LDVIDISICSPIYVTPVIAET